FVGARGYCALATQLVCWGSSVGPSPVVAGGGALAGTSLTDVGIGESAFCAVGDGVLACWGGSTSDALLGRSDVLVSATPLEVDGSRGLAGDTCPSGWTPAGSQRCAPGAGIDVQYRVSYGKRGWTTDPVAAVIIREATPWRYARSRAPRSPTRARARCSAGRSPGLSSWCSGWRCSSCAVVASDARPVPS